MISAAAIAERRVAAVRDDPSARLALLHRLYTGDRRSRGRQRHLPYRRAASAFMRWQLNRGLLNSLDGANPGSPWWREVNERLLRDTAEARALAGGAPGAPSSSSVEVGLAFIHRPSAAAWYRAHNHSIVSAYLELEDLAAHEDRVERFFINLALMRVLYAHALVAAPGLALGRFAGVAPPLGDPRLGMTAIFLSLSHVLPERYPLGDDVTPFVEAEHGVGHLLDVGVIQPRVAAVYQWSAAELGLPRLAELLDGDVPAYAWDSTDADHWRPVPSRFARWARLAAPSMELDALEK
jgi:hypothetical protein